MIGHPKGRSLLVMTLMNTFPRKTFTRARARASTSARARASARGGWDIIMVNKNLNFSYLEVVET